MKNRKVKIDINNSYKSIENTTAGITLIALVITIIVLLILAGVSIATLTGNNGILGQAKQADTQTEIATIAEKINIISQEQTMYRQTGKDYKTTFDIMKENNQIRGNNTLEPQNIISDAKLGKGDAESYKDIYEIRGDKLVYWNSKGEIEAEKSIILSNEQFITKWNVQAGDVIKLPIGISGWNDNFIVNWGDGSPEETVNDFKERLSQLPQHTYTNAGIYQITITGICKHFTFSTWEDSERDTLASKLIEIVSWGDIDAVAYEFVNAINLEGMIPSPTKNTFKYINSDGFEYLFLGCEKIAQIPQDLFANIPETVTSFESTFEKCKSLTQIPEGLFSKAINATNFRKTFYRCNNIEKIPDNIFENNPNITNLYATFYDLNKITTVPKLWERTTTGLDGTACFGSCDILDTSTIPSPWANSL